MEVLVSNPFYFGNEVSGDDFCNRVRELDVLKHDIDSGLNVLLYAPRRFGKTSLLKKLKQNLSGEAQYKVVFFDWFSVASVEEFIQRYFDAIAHSFDATTDKLFSFFKSVLQLHPNISMSIGALGETSYSLSLDKKEEGRVLEEVLNLPYLYARHKQVKVVVIWDEFQEVEQFHLEKKIRSVIQAHSRHVSYIFSGSKKSILAQMFNDKGRAFYRSVKHLRIDEVHLDDWLGFAMPKFQATGKQILPEQIEEIYSITAGFPYYMQQLLFMVWDDAEQVVTEQSMKRSLALMLERENDLYALIWSQLTQNQKKAAKHIIRNAGASLYANDALRISDLSATTLKSTLESLLKKDVCDRAEGRYYFVDPFMAYWLERLL